MFTLFGGLCSAQVSVSAQATVDARVGANLPRLRDWDTSWVFADLFKRARTWIPQVPGTTVPWNSGAVLATNADGWPLLAPGQAAATLLTRDLGDHYPGGPYVCLYTGTGGVSLSFDAQVTSQTPGRIELFVTPTDEGILCKIESSDPNDPVRDIRVVPAEFESTFESQPFHPLFLERSQRYDTLRFMDWQETNGSTQAVWSDRPTPATFSQATERGVALEYVAELCNTLQADAWVCVPHLADDNYVTQMATLLRDALDPNLRVWIEHSNEVWNSIYPQAVHATAAGVALGLSPDPYQASLFYHSQRSVSIFEQFEAVFGGTERLVRVLSAQMDNPWTGEQVLLHEDAYAQADALAIAHYFGRELGTPEQLSSTLGLSVPELLNELGASVEAGREDLAENQAQAAALGVELIAYEAGQHLVGVSFLVDNDELGELFQAANRAPGMGPVFKRALDLWAELGGGLWCAYHTAGRYDNHGSWGLLEHQDQPLQTAHKYVAVQEWIDAHAATAPYGTLCGGLVAGSSGTPQLGSADFTLRASGAPPFAPALLALGKSNTALGAQPLPVGLDVLAPGCQLYTSAEYDFATAANAYGTASVTLGVPPDPIYVGYELFAQWAVLAPETTPSGIAFSAGLAIQLQP